MQVATIHASRMHPVFAEILCHQLQARGMQPSPPRPPDVVRELIDKHPAPPIGSADAI